MVALALKTVSTPLRKSTSICAKDVVSVLPLIPPSSTRVNWSNCATLELRSSRSWHLSAKASTRPKAAAFGMRHGLSGVSMVDWSLASRYAVLKTPNMRMMLRRACTTCGACWWRSRSHKASGSTISMVFWISAFPSARSSVTSRGGVL
eukprot:scaffold902_cov242-Pinguiococcus_pyrenoidosus.AAC.8